MNYLSSALTTCVLILLGCLCLRGWLTRPQADTVLLRAPQGDMEASRAAGRTGAPPIRAGDHCNRLQTHFIAGTPSPETPSSSWPGFRGPHADNIVPDSVPLSSDWEALPPRILWTVSTGEGHAAPAVYRGRVYILDYDEERQADALRCLSLATGEEVWRRWYSVKIKRNHGISRTIPAVSEDAVVTIGPKCHVMCVERETGDLRWGLDLEKDYGTTVPLWYTGQCPLIEDGAAIIAPGGHWLLMAVDCRSGEILWHTENPRQWRMSHSSVVPLRFGGQGAYVYAALGGIVAVSAEPGNRGQLLWETDQWDRRIVAPSPVMLPGERLLMTSGHGAGSIILPIVSGQDGFVVEEGLSLDKSEFASEQQTPIVHNGRLYAVLPKDAGSLREQLVCYSPERGLIWHSGKDLRFGLGPYLLAGGKLLVLADDGTLYMVAADSDRFELLGEFKLMDGRDAWGPLVLVDGLLLARDDTRLFCLDLRAAAKEASP